MSQNPQEFEEEFHLRLGRYREEDEKEIERLFRPNHPGSGHYNSQIKRQRQAMAWRSRTISNGWRFSAGPQAVVKAVGNTKSVRGAKAMVRYISRTRPVDKSGNDVSPSPNIFDELGRPLDSAKPDVLLREWTLMEDHENLSKKTREKIANEDERDRGQMEERDRLHHVQAWHFVLSIKSEKEKLEADEKALKRATVAFVSSIFGLEGYKAIWCIHRDKPSHPHAHLIVSARSRFGERIRSDKHGDFLFWLRVQLTMNLKQAGLDFDASCREDRPLVRDKILRNFEPLRPRDRRQFKDGNLAERAPRWWQRYARKDHDKTKVSDRVERIPDIDDAIVEFSQKMREAPKSITGRERFWDIFDFAFKKPYRAIECWLALARENAKRDKDGLVSYPNLALSFWYLKKHPAIFGNLKKRGNKRVAAFPSYQNFDAVKVARNLDRVATYSRKILKDEFQAEKIKIRASDSIRYVKAPEQRKTSVDKVREVFTKIRQQIPLAEKEQSTVNEQINTGVKGGEKRISKPKVVRRHRKKHRKKERGV